MADQFLAEIRIFPFNFAPQGWAVCNGQLLPISQNTALFSLLGTTYGGDGRSTFGLPNLQCVAPLQPGQGPGLSLRDLGETGGQQTVTLAVAEIPAHSHTVGASTIPGTQTSPAGNVWSPTAGRRGGVNVYSATAGTSPPLNPAASGTTGGNQPHNNMPPNLVLNFCIALTGIFPQRP